MIKNYTACICALLTLLTVESSGQEKKQGFNLINELNSYDVSWNTPGPTSSQSMPTGNGDIGLNVWVENGDVCFFISKTDAWGATPKEYGGTLMKLGMVRISVRPAPSFSAFQQTLNLYNSEISIKEGNADNEIDFRIWADANHPVVRVETKSVQRVSVKVTLEDWRIGNGDTILSTANRITWYHKNYSGCDPHLQGFIFGAAIAGKNLVKKSDAVLESKDSANSEVISIYPQTTNSSTTGEWTSGLDKQISQTDALNLEKTRTAHQQWWHNFWNRSWIFLTGDGSANAVTQGYILQRYVTACAGRGAYPIKFNGSIFIVNKSYDADYRTWGGQYWFQNTRAMYWPRLGAGDFDMMLPLFNMYAAMMPENSAQVRKYYKHDGVYFQETAPFWGGLPYMAPEVAGNYTGHYFTPILELSMMMLDYYEYTQDKKFAKQMLLPIATEGLRFFYKHFGLDANGKLLLDPDNAIEMFWKVRNPTPDIAGLYAVLSRLVTLPPDLIDAKLIEEWKLYINQLPGLPASDINGKQTILPYSGPQTAMGFNSENPELYALYPFRIYCLGKDNLQVAINTFEARKYKAMGCWSQDPIQAAMVGKADVAKQYVTFNLTRKDPALKFPAFWAAGNDYEPDEDNGGNGENGLQKMLIQAEGKKIILLPAWPKGWNAEFKLNAPYNTTVQGKVEDGKLTNLIVTPSRRKVDVIVMPSSN